MQVDVVVVAYRSAADLRSCVEPLCGRPSIRVIVVDNACPGTLRARSRTYLSRSSQWHATPAFLPACDEDTKTRVRRNGSRAPSCSSAALHSRALADSTRGSSSTARTLIFVRGYDVAASPCGMTQPLLHRMKAEGHRLALSSPRCALRRACYMRELHERALRYAGFRIACAVHELLRVPLAAIRSRPDFRGRLAALGVALGASAPRPPGNRTVPARRFLPATLEIVGTASSDGRSPPAGKFRKRPSVLRWVAYAVVRRDTGAARLLPAAGQRVTGQSPSVVDFLIHANGGEFILRAVVRCNRETGWVRRRIQRRL
jgi:hypothetical protein